MEIKINEQKVKIVFVDFDNRYDGWFNNNTNEIRLVETANNLKVIIVHELTHAYLYYYGFSGAELTEELMCNFVEIYAERIIKESERILKWKTK